MTTTELGPLAIRRITLDCKNLLAHASSGLFYVGDENDISKGHAIVFGCEGTPYYGGAFCFEVTFPHNYPFSPPVFNYLTNDGRMRFNPNLYKNGKVCLSLLNTWAGEPWSGVQSLSSILQSIQADVLNEEPLRNEPAYSKMSVHTDIPIYNRLVQHATAETAILGYLKHPPPYLEPFHAQFKAHVLKARPAILDTLKKLESWDDKIEGIDFYRVSQKYRFRQLAEELSAIPNV
jgi:hypothetical protein